MRKQALRIPQSVYHALISRKSAIALLLCLIILAVAVLSADQSPQWIYQGF
jgi:hypothetical protein